jgi:hypothetical protein
MLLDKRGLFVKGYSFIIVILLNQLVDLIPFISKAKDIYCLVTYTLFTRCDIIVHIFRTQNEEPYHDLEQKMVDLDSPNDIQKEYLP